MKILKKIKEKIMAMSNSGYGFGWLDPNQGLLGTASQGNSMLGTAAQQGYNNAQQAQLAQQRAQMQYAMAQQAVQQQAISRTLSAFNLNANAEYTFEELNDEGSVYNMPLQTAVDLAINMFGSSWFKDEDTIKVLEENTDFLIKVMAKIYKAGNLKHERYRTEDRLGAASAWKIIDTEVK